jgi:hypothetical protein
MNNVYSVLDAVGNYLKNDPLNKSISFGDIFEVDLNKQTIFPLTHIVMNSAGFRGSDLNVIAFNMDFICMDVVDLSKENPRDSAEVTPVLGRVDNLEDVFNSTLMILNGLAAELNRGTLYQNGFQLDGEIQCLPFKESYGNELAGWNMSLTILTPNTSIVPARCRT